MHFNLPQRILMTADTIGGVWTYALELTRQLNGRGIDVAIATMGVPMSPVQAREAAQLDRLEIYESDYKLEWMNDPWGDVDAASDWLLELEQRVDPDVVHLNGYVHASAAWNSPTLVVAHSCVLSWWRAVMAGSPDGEWDQYRRQVAAGLRSAGCVVAPTRSMLDSLETNYCTLRNKRVVANGREPSLLSNSQRKEPVVFSAGRLWDAAKNVSALTNIRLPHPWKVRVAGEISAPPGCDSDSSTANIQTLGPLSSEQMADQYSRAAIYALPARYEPFGLSALEAGLAGCALVLGDIPSLREVWKDAALFVSPDDPEDLQSAISQLINVPDMREQYSQLGRERAMNFTPDRMADGYLSIYSELMSEKAVLNPERMEEGVCV